MRIHFSPAREPSAYDLLLVPLFRARIGATLDSSTTGHSQQVQGRTTLMLGTIVAK